jgi:hypothetical protein
MSKASGRYRFPPPRTVPAYHQWPVLTVEELKARVRAEATSVPAEVVEKILADWTGYAVLCEWQDGRCAVCGVSGVALVDDHDHRTALLRGQLCRRCNTREGREEGPLWDSYRARPPAVILGVNEVYWSPITGYAEPEPEPTSTPSAQAASLLNFPWPPKDG